jgi:hypothetical protein
MTADTYPLPARCHDQLAQILAKNTFSCTEPFAHIEQVRAASGSLPGQVLAIAIAWANTLSTYSTGKDHAKPIGKLVVVLPFCN